jgi:ABC-type antimicrobial peptide transport system ATPase subunit
MSGSITFLSCYNLDYLRCILDKANRLYYNQNNEEGFLHTDLMDFFTLICINALENNGNPKHLLHKLNRLLGDIGVSMKIYHSCRLDTAGLVYLRNFLEALKLVIIHGHNMRCLLYRDLPQNDLLGLCGQAKINLELEDNMPNVRFRSIPFM